MEIFVCDRGYEAIMTCIYTAWERALKVGHDNIRIENKENVRPNLIDTLTYVDVDYEKADKVGRSVKNKISYKAFTWIYRASLSADSEAPDAIYRFMILGFKVGADVTEMLTENSVMQLMRINRQVGNEVHHFLEFARFNSTDGRAYICHLEPKNDVIYMVACHFADRMPSEDYMIIDDNRHIAAVHPRDSAVYMRELTDDEVSRLSTSESYEDGYTQMWRSFFEAIAIKQRINPRCQNTLFPKWKRKHATEFM